MQKRKVKRNTKGNIKFKKPTVIKLSPDLSDDELGEICDLVLKSNSIDGLILTNTTIKRDNLNSKPVKNF